jgi:hypothetical protein
MSTGALWRIDSKWGLRCVRFLQLLRAGEIEVSQPRVAGPSDVGLSLCSWSAVACYRLGFGEACFASDAHLLGACNVRYYANARRWRVSAIPVAGLGFLRCQFNWVRWRGSDDPRHTSQRAPRVIEVGSLILFTASYGPGGAAASCRKDKAQASLAHSKKAFASIARPKENTPSTNAGEYRIGYLPAEGVFSRGARDPN